MQRGEALASRSRGTGGAGGPSSSRPYRRRRDRGWCDRHPAAMSAPAAWKHLGMQVLFDHVGYEPDAPKLLLVEAAADTDWDRGRHRASPVRSAGARVRAHVRRRGRWLVVRAVVVGRRHATARARPLRRCAGASGGRDGQSEGFTIGDDAHGDQLVSDIVHYIKGQRCSGIWDARRPRGAAGRRRRAARRARRLVRRLGRRQQVPQPPLVRQLHEPAADAARGVGAAAGVASLAASRARRRCCSSGCTTRRCTAPTSWCGCRTRRASST